MRVRAQMLFRNMDTRRSRQGPSNNLMRIFMILVMFNKFKYYLNSKLVTNVGYHSAVIILKEMAIHCFPESRPTSATSIVRDLKAGRLHWSGISSILEHPSVAIVSTCKPYRNSFLSWRRRQQKLRWVLKRRENKMMTRKKKSVGNAGFQLLQNTWKTE